MASTHVMLHRYLEARGLEIHDGYRAEKVVEEAVELVEECRREQPDLTKIMHELADVVFAATVLAEHYGFTVEQAMEAKIDLDRGREARRLGGEESREVLVDGTERGVGGAGGRQPSASNSR